MKTAIIFSRCSSSGAVEARQDTTRQVEDLQRYATTNHLTIIKIFQEHISGGKANKDRPICLVATYPREWVTIPRPPDYILSDTISLFL